MKPTEMPSSHSMRGNAALLELPATAFLCSTRCPGDKVLDFFDWARCQCDEQGTVISGFHTPVEKDVLAILARRGANIVWVPARDLPKRTPKLLQTAEAQGRLLILTPFREGKPSRPDRRSCALRNAFVLEQTGRRFIGYIHPESNLLDGLLYDIKP